MVPFYWLRIITGVCNKNHHVVSFGLRAKGKSTLFKCEIGTMSLQKRLISYLSTKGVKVIGTPFLKSIDPLWFPCF